MQFLYVGLILAPTSPALHTVPLWFTVSGVDSFYRTKRSIVFVIQSAV